jgi:hypothetical protein
MGFISIRVADFYAGSPNLTQPSTFSHRGLGTGNGSVFPSIFMLPYSSFLLIGDAFMVDKSAS